MTTYLLYAWPTVLLSVGLGLAFGWLTWGRGRRSALAAERDTLRRLAFGRNRDLADRDSTIAILREELATEATETARLRRLLDAMGESSWPPAEPAPGPGPAHGRPKPSPSVFAVAARRAAEDPEGLAPVGDPTDGVRRGRRAAES